MASIESGRALRWFAGELRRNRDIQLINVGPDHVHAVLPTMAGPSDLILKQYNDLDASMHLHVAAEPEGTNAQKVKYHDRENALASSLFDRRIDHVGGHVYYGKDFRLTRDLELDKEILGKTAFELSEELPYIRRHHLDTTKGMRAKAK
jgi:hypothetical protein